MTFNYTQDTDKQGKEKKRCVKLEKIIKNIFQNKYINRNFLIEYSCIKYR